MSLLFALAGIVPNGAIFSPCLNYRYRLWRQWDEGKLLHFCGLNPSTADEVLNDPTISRLIKRAKQLGFSGLQMTNAFAYRATDPKVMKSQDDPVGPENDEAILTAAKMSAMTIVGWGKDGWHKGRQRQIVEMLEEVGITMHCLGVNKDGTPKHPLYLAYSVQPQIFI